MSDSNFRMISETKQKYTYENYRRILKRMMEIVVRYRNNSVDSARRNRLFNNIIGYPVKLLLGTSLSGGAIEALGNLDENQNWVSYLRSALEFTSLVLLTTQDFGKFEKKEEKFMHLSSTLGSFINILQRQMNLKKGYEGDREDVLLELETTFEGIKNSNAIIRTFDSKDDVLSFIHTGDDNTILLPSQEKQIDDIESEYNDASSHSQISQNDEVDIELGRSSPSMVRMRSPRPSVMNGRIQDTLVRDILTRF